MGRGEFRGVCEGKEEGEDGIRWVGGSLGGYVKVRRRVRMVLYIR